MPAAAELSRSYAEVPVQVQSASTEAPVQRRRTVLDRVLPWRREPASEKVMASDNGTVLYEKGKGGRVARKVAGETMVWGGGIYGVYNLVTLDLPGALAGGVVHVAGRWVRPKEGQ